MSNERSVSRGREQQVYSTGRGGAGNIRQDSGSRTRDIVTGVEDISQTRGRELPGVTPGKVYASGRGGAGNIRSPSRGDAIENRNALREEAQYVREHTNTDAPVSHGRGGAGNISNSRSRSRSRDPGATPGNPAAVGVLHGRGGIGNFRPEDPSTTTSTTLERLAEEEDTRKAQEYHEKEQKEGKLHSIGRGGFANLFHRTTHDDKSTRDKSTDVSRSKPSGEFISTGRGGGGNIYQKV
ncbi:hypothetical protein CPB86DRAFT_778808 [Serendipita vermifera]|nr:hypothetical protein CPB86DRAFT_778808 [Serendipita vermifera]